LEKPKFTYRIWHTPRVGSNLLCQLLEDTLLAGKPGEHVTLHGQSSLSERYGTKIYKDLINKVWDLGTGSNGVFGVKLSHHAHYSNK
jgi:LPS sulfotransferase NodH